MIVLYWPGSFFFGQLQYDSQIGLGDHAPSVHLYQWYDQCEVKGTIIWNDIEWYCFCLFSYVFVAWNPSLFAILWDELHNISNVFEQDTIIKRPYTMRHQYDSLHPGTHHFPQSGVYTFITTMNISVHAFLHILKRTVRMNCSRRFIPTL